MKRSNFNSLITEEFGVPGVLYNPLLGKIANNVSAGVFISQILYWWDKGHKKGMFYKTVEELRMETCLSKNNQRTAIKIWSELGVLKIVKKGIPPKRHFIVDFEKLRVLLSKARKEFDKEYPNFSWQNEGKAGEISEKHDAMSQL